MQASGSRAGTVLRAKWRLDGLLAEGGMGAVYAASHVRSGKRAAIKVLHAGTSGEIAERFLREARISAILSDPGVVDVYDDDTTDDGLPYLVMELLEGETLEQRAERCGGTLGWAHLATLVDAALSTLAGAHQLGVVHRDLKPSNLFLTAGGTLKVLDFGIASLRASPHDRITGAVSPTMGTIGFMPPEQASGSWERIDARSDIWAVGATMFVLLTGRHVHEATNLHKELVSALTSPAPPIKSVAPELPAPIARVVDRALQFEPERRYPSAGAMRRALLQAVAEVEGRSFDDLDEPTEADPSSVGIANGAPLGSRATARTPPSAVAASSSPTVAASPAALRPEAEGPAGGETLAALQGADLPRAPRVAPRRPTTVAVALVSLAAGAIAAGAITLFSTKPSAPGRAPPPPASTPVEARAALPPPTPEESAPIRREPEVTPAPARSVAPVPRQPPATRSAATVSEAPAPPSATAPAAPVDLDRRK